jgi:hypothetical protein
MNCVALYTDDLILFMEEFLDRSLDDAFALVNDDHAVTQNLYFGQVV